MNLAPESIDSFVEAYEESYGETLTPGEAGVMLGTLMEMYLRIHGVLESKPSLKESLDRQFVLEQLVSALATRIGALSAA